MRRIFILSTKRFPLAERFCESVRKRGCLVSPWDSLRKHDDLLIALSITSNSLTGRQRKPSPSQDDELTVVTSCCHCFYSKQLVNHMFEARVPRANQASSFSWALEHPSTQINRNILRFTCIYILI